MFSCFICNKRFPESKSLTSHLKFYHPKELDKKRLTCNFENCFQVFSLLKTYIYHLKTHVTNETPVKVRQLEMSSHSVSDKADPIMNLACSSVPDKADQVVELNTAIKSEDGRGKNTKGVINDYCENFVVNLLENKSMTRKSVLSIIEQVDIYQFGMFDLLRTMINKNLDNNNVDTKVKSEVNILFDEFLDPFSSLDTEYKLLKNLENKNYFIKPEPYFIASTLQTTRKLNELELGPKTLVAHRIPLCKQLKFFFELPGVLAEAKAYMNDSREANKIKDFIDGNLWKEKKKYFLQKTVFPLFLFYDDFQPDNPLGSHACITKLGAVYLTPKCFPPKYLSKLENIFLTALFHSDDRATYGNDVAFGPIIDELILLETEGIEVTVKSKTETIHFCLALILSDNLGLHSALGLLESFSANYACLLCKVNKDTMHNQVREDPALLRSFEQYSNDINPIVSSESGIKEPCVWNRIPSFHFSQNIIADSLHDWQEGILPYDLAKILNNFINQNLFTLDTLNNKIDTFQYGFLELSNKPPIISKDSISKGKLKMSACEMTTFLTVFRFLVGKFINETCLEWKLYIKLLEIGEIINSKSISLHELSTLSDLIEDHNKYYKTLFGDLKPKYHHLLHYEYVIKQSGNPCHLRGNRYESKHSQLKQIASTTPCRKNVTLTLSVRYQLSVCKRFYNQFGLASEFECGIKKIKNLMYSFKLKLDASLVPNCFLGEIVCTDRIKVDGHTYQVGSRILVSTDGIWPTFGEIVAISFDNEQPILLIKKFHSLMFSTKYHAYEVTRLNKYVRIDLNVQSLPPLVWLYQADHCFFIVQNFENI